MGNAYTMNLTSDNRLGGGTYADVYRVQKKDTKKFYAAKFLRAEYSMTSEGKTVYNREVQLLKEVDHPFVIKYQDNFEYKGAKGK
jgi:serine/threonine protein kinase